MTGLLLHQDDIAQSSLHDDLPHPRYDSCPISSPIRHLHGIIGGTVWSGAWAETTKVELGPVKGVVTHTPWNSWIVNSVVTSGTYAPGEKTPTVLGSSSYVPNWSTVYSAPTAAPKL